MLRGVEQVDAQLNASQPVKYSERASIKFLNLTFTRRPAAAR